MKERTQTYDAWEGAKGGKLTGAEIPLIDELCIEFHDDKVREAIKICAAQGVPKIAYLRKVLENQRSGKGKPLDRTGDGRKAPAAQYEQREYKETGFEELPDWMKEGLAQMNGGGTV